MVKRAFVATLLLSTLARTAAAQPEAAPDFPGPAPEHALLKRFVGVWETTSECSTGPGAEPMRNHGKMRSRMLGERWVVNEQQIDAEGTQVNTLQTLGFDPKKGKYVGTWADSVLNHLWVYEGAYDEATRTLTLETEGPNLMAGGELTRFRDTYEFASDDRIVVRSLSLGSDGAWVEFLTGDCRRRTELAPDASD